MITLKGPYALGFDESNNNRPVPCTYLWRNDVLEQTLVATGKHVNDKTSEVLDAVVLSCVNLWSYNYFHFVTECLGSLVMTDLSKVDKIIIVNHPPKYMIEAFQLLGVQDKLVRWSGTPLSVSNLVSPYQARSNGYSTLNSVAALRNRFILMSWAERNYYISRKDAVTRRVYKEQDVAGFDTIVCSELSFNRQVRTFSYAKRILGPHGAGMTNMIWAPRGCQVVELFGEYKNDCYMKLAHTLGHQYASIACSEKDGQLVMPSEASSE